MAVCLLRTLCTGSQSTVWSASWRHPAIIRTLTLGASIHNTLWPTCVTQRLPPTTSYSSQSANATTTSKTDLSFEDYRKLRKALKTRARVAGVPLAFIGMGISSFVNVHLNPRMFETPPEEIQLILLVKCTFSFQYATITIMPLGHCIFSTQIYMLSFHINYDVCLCLFLFSSQSLSVWICSGLDPIVFAGLCGVGSGVVSYLLGGAIFTATWKILSKEKAKQLNQVCIR